MSLPGTNPSDVDQDGIDDLLEFAFTGDPFSSASRPLPLPHPVNRLSHPVIPLGSRASAA